MISKTHANLKQDHLTLTPIKQERISTTTGKYREFRREVNGSVGRLVGGREILVNEGEKKCV